MRAVGRQFPEEDSGTVSFMDERGDGPRPLVLADLPNGLGERSAET